MPGHRCSRRLEKFDYSQGGVYFVTLCINEHKCILGNVQNGEMVLNEVGMMMDKWWQKLPDKFNGVRIDQYCIMPNHIHGILHVVGADPCVRPLLDGHICPLPDGHIRPQSGGLIRPSSMRPGTGRTHGSAPTITLGAIVQWFKTMTTNEYIRHVKIKHWSAFYQYLWQRSFHDHVIRDNEDLMHVYAYILNNPVNWADDDENPNRIKVK